MHTNMDVVLHYKSQQSSFGDLVRIAEKVLEEFPSRAIPPPFTPWFPSGNVDSLPFRPEKAPPVFSLQDLKQLQCCLQQSGATPASESPGVIEALRDFSTADVQGVPICSWVYSERIHSKHCEPAVSDEKTRPKRCWSVFCQPSVSENIQPFSAQFQEVVGHFHLHCLQRAKWVIEERNCVTSSLEHAWNVLCRSIRQSKLPTCNANIQRDLGQIWVFCDVLYSEYVGEFLKCEFQLTGPISLSVHKQGIIFNM